jgi:DNA-binding transcriptional ArsR family regulator
VTLTSTPLDDDLSLTFAALADPTRRSILARLAEGDATVNELAEPYAMSQQAVSKHLKVLERAGLVSRTRAAQARPCHLEPEPLDAAADWIARHRRLWGERYDRLDAHLATLRAHADPATRATPDRVPDPRDQERAP